MLNAASGLSAEQQINKNMISLIFKYEEYHLFLLLPLITL